MCVKLSLEPEDRVGYIQASEMPLSIEGLLRKDPEDVLEWDDILLDEALEALKMDIGGTWSKSKKAYEVNKAIKEQGVMNKENVKACKGCCDIMFDCLSCCLFDEDS